MSLRVWLPLNGDLDNQGLDDITVTNSRATVDDNGKIGKCYNFDGTYAQFTNPLPNPCTAFSVCGWVRLTSGYKANYGLHLLSFQQTYGRICISKDGLAVRVLLTNGNGNYLGGSTTTASSLSAGVWNHYAVTFDVGKVKVYINGVLDSESTANISSVVFTETVCRIGTFKTETSKGCVNDFRIYDRALSAKEIKELSKGLVAHYTLDDMVNTSNLIINGYGELGGNIGWANTNVSTTEIPSGHSEIKASFYTGNMTKDYILLYPDHSYTLETYIKSSGATSGNTYPSIYPYDADKKFINNYNSLSGFDVSTKTTLKQPLKKGDTVIYANDLSKWNTASNYYYFVAIFGYKNSYGEVYDDLVYTADAPTFGTYSDKSNIDKTNNTITLDAPFTGEDRPIGTAICQSTAGGTYYYPFGGIALSTLSDWVHKTATFNPKNTPRLMAAKYIKYSTYYSTYHAGIRLIDNDVDSSIVYDSSGYCNNGIAHGDLTISPDTPRYSISTNFVNSPYIQTILPLPSGDGKHYTFSWWGKYTNYGGRMMWGYANGNRLNLYMVSSNFYWNTGDGTSNPFGVSAATYGDNAWHHFAVTGDGTTTKLYIDGEYKADAKVYRPITGTTLIFNGWDTSTSYDFNGSLSDFRLYVTTLSEEDIQELYQSAGSVDNHGNSFMYEYKEE